LLLSDWMRRVGVIIYIIRGLFDSMGDLSAAKTAVTRALRKVAAADAPISDFTFAKEVRLGSYRGPSLPPAAVVANRAWERDPMDEPQHGERVAYVVVAGGPHAVLRDLVVSPRKFVAMRGSLRLHATYYVKQLINALKRVLGLAGADVDAWYKDVPRGLHAPSTMAAGAPPVTLDAFWASRNCVICSAPCSRRSALCDDCQCAPETAALAFVTRVRAAERGLLELDGACTKCSACDQTPIECVSLDCRVYLKRAAMENMYTSAQDGLAAAFS
jgi:DNA polymerase zeta